MRLRSRWQRPFYAKKATSVKDSMGAENTVYGDPAQFRGNIQPVTDTTILEAYGATQKRLYDIFMDSADGIDKMDGVCLGIHETDPPNFEVVDILPWLGHVEVYIRGLV